MARRYLHHTETLRLRQLRHAYGKNKLIPFIYELPALTALSHYPELEVTGIDFVCVNAPIPLFSTVMPLSILNSAKGRIYRINIAEHISTKERGRILLRNFDFNKQVAALGHQLAHITDYISKTPLEIIKTGILYNFKSCKISLEHRMNKITIDHGLGEQLLDLSKMVAHLQCRFPHDKYYKTYFDYYLAPDQIEKELKSYTEKIRGGN